MRRWCQQRPNQAAPRPLPHEPPGSPHATHVRARRLKESVRPLALESLAALAKHVSDSDTATLVAQALATLKVLDGSAEGRIKVASERGVLVAALAALCPPLPARPQGEAFLPVVSGLAAFGKDEGESWHGCACASAGIMHVLRH